MRRGSTIAEDEALATRIKIALREDRETGGLPIDVHASDGTVTLLGRVDTPEQRAAAEALARRTLPVKQVINQLIVNQPEGS